MQQEINEEERLALHLLNRRLPAASNILNYLIEYANEDGWVMIKQTKISRALAYSIATVRVCLLLLKKYHYIDTQKHGTMNVYRINRLLMGLSVHQNRFTHAVTYRGEKMHD